MKKPDYFDALHGTKIAYNRINATSGNGPGVIFCGGLMSDMERSKALALEEMCVADNRPFIRFDYQGHGQSSGLFKEGTIGLWFKDTLSVIDNLTEGPQIIVGSSMGGWVSLLAAKARTARIKAFVGIAAAPDFTERLWNHELDDAARLSVKRDGYVEIPSDYGDEPYTFTKALFEDGWNNRVLGAPLNLNIPIRLIHGLEDADVPWETALEIADKAVGEDIDITLVPGGDHRLSSDRDLARLKATVSVLCS